MVLTYDEIDQHLIYIFNGVMYTYIDDLLLLLKFPSNDIKQRAQLVYKKSFDDAVKKGILPVKELEELIEKRNLITVEEILQLKKLKSQLEAQEILLGKTTRVKANQERIKQVISRLRHEIYQIEFKKKSKLFLSAETKAEEERTFYICSRCVFWEDKSLFWPTYEVAKKENRLDLRDKILLEYLKFYSGLSIKIIREIARSGLWRIRYINSIKTSDPLFGIPASDYTQDQLNLTYWSNYYQNIYEMLSSDRPSEATIEDDDALDAYMKAYYDERNREDAMHRSKSKRSGKLSAFDSEEVIITKSHELYQDINYDTPRESQKIKDRVDIKKKAKGLGRK
jgi:SepF-like predicted cell division protein (DUF552 family)